MITVEGLSRAFGDVQAVRDLSFSAADGAVTTLLGANGSGKSTTFNSIAGLIRPDTGRALIDTIDVAVDRRAALARLGVFPDQFGLYKRLTTREHLTFFAELAGMARHDIAAAIADIVAMLGIEDIIDRRTDGFSQGQRMKTALAGVLVTRPANVILDEPTRGLDVMSILTMRRTLKALKARGICVLMSSHVLAEVEEVSDHVVILHQGRKIAEGPPESLRDQTGCARLEDAFVHLIGMESIDA